MKVGVEKLRLGGMINLTLDELSREILKLRVADYKSCKMMLRLRMARFGGGKMPLCPECETDLDFEEDEVDEGDVVSCPECAAEFEVVGTNPLELSHLEEDEDEDLEEEEEE